MVEPASALVEAIAADKKAPAEPVSSDLLETVMVLEEAPRGLELEAGKVSTVAEMGH